MFSCLTGSSWAPTVRLFSQARGTLRYDEALGSRWNPTRSAQRERSTAGSCRDIFDLKACLEDGCRVRSAAAARAVSVEPRLPG